MKKILSKIFNTIEEWYITIILLVLLYTLSFDVNIQNNLSLSKIDTEILRIKLVSYIEQDLKNHFSKKSFTSFSNDINYLINTKKYKVNFSVPISAFINKSKNKSLLNIKEGSLSTIFNTINNYRFRHTLSNIYVHTVGSNKFIYKIDTKAMNIMLIKIQDIPKFNVDKYIKIEYPTRTIYFNNKDEFIDKYQDELKPYIDTTRLMDKKINDELSNYINNKNIAYKEKYQFFLLLSFIVLVISLSYKQVTTEGEYNIKLAKIDEIGMKQLEFTESYKKIQESMSHDMKTNSTFIVASLEKIWSAIHECINDDTIRYNIYKIYGAEYFKASADLKYEFLTIDNHITFPKDFESETLYEELIYILEHQEYISNNSLNGDILKLIKYTNSFENSYVSFKANTNQYSSIIFSLLSNAFKHGDLFGKNSIELNIYENQNQFYTEVISYFRTNNNGKDRINRIDDILKYDENNNYIATQGLLRTRRLSTELGFEFGYSYTNISIRNENYYKISFFIKKG